MKDKRFEEARDLVKQHGGEYVRDTRHGELWSLGNQRLMLQKRANQSTDWHAARNTLARVKRIIKQQNLSPVERERADATPWSPPPILAVPAPDDPAELAAIESEHLDLQAETQPEQEQQHPMAKKKAKKKATKKVTKKLPRPKVAKKKAKKKAARPAARSDTKSNRRRSDTTLPTPEQQQAVRQLVVRSGGRQGAAKAAKISLATLDRVLRGSTPVREYILRKLDAAANGDKPDSGHHKRVNGAMPLAERIADVIAARLTGAELPRNGEMDQLCRRVERIERVILELGEQLGVEL